MIKVVCDRCGREIPVPGRTGYLAWNFRTGHGGELAGDNMLEDRDYCETCMGTIFDFIEHMPGQGATDAGTEREVPGTEGAGDFPEDGKPAAGAESCGPQLPESPADSPGIISGSSAVTEKDRDGKKRVRKPGKNSVDMGKILALREAGRSFGWIADDMGLSKQTVCNAFYRWKRAQEGEALK